MIDPLLLVVAGAPPASDVAQTTQYLPDETPILVRLRQSLHACQCSRNTLASLPRGGAYLYWVLGDNKQVTMAIRDWSKDERPKELTPPRAR